MASAVMSSRNEPYWGDNKTHMRNNTYIESNTHRFNYNPNPNIGNVVPNHAAFRRNEDVYVASNIRRREGHERRLDDSVASTAVSDSRGGTDGVNDCTELLSAEIGYWTFDRSDYTRDELKELKKRFVVELEQVRTFRRQIDLGRVCSESGHTGAAPNVVIDCDTEDNPLPVMYQNQYNPKMDVLNAATKRNPKQHYSKKRLSGLKNQNRISAAKNREAKRLKVDPAMDKLMNSMKKRCGEILGELMRHKHGWVFNKPVDAVKMGLLDYHQIVENPMDLGTVKSKLRKGEYATPLDFAADVSLTFNNAMLYNPEGQDAHVMAKLLLSNFNVMFHPMKKRFEDDCQLMKAAEEAHQSLSLNSPPVVDDVTPQVPVPTQKKSFPCRGQVTPISSTIARPSTPLTGDAVKPVMIQEKLPRPKARDRNEWTMSYDEKLNLSVMLQNLPEDDMVQLLNIVKSRTGHLNQDGDEIEIDIESMDNEMLWELDRFVGNAHKMASKTMRQQQGHGILSHQNAEPEINNKLAQHHDLPETDEQTYKKLEAAGEEDVDIGEEIMMSHYPPVEIERDGHDANHSCRSNTSSSTSSSSGSSSSGSGSASSSGSESEDVDTLQSPYIEFKDAQVEVMMA